MTIKTTLDLTFEELSMIQKILEAAQESFDDPDAKDGSRYLSTGHFTCDLSESEKQALDNFLS